MSFRTIVSKVVLAGALLVLVAGCAATPTVLGQSDNGSVAGGLGAIAGAIASNQVAAASNGGFTVTGMGIVSGTPDIVQVNVGVDTQGTTVEDAVKGNQAQMTSLLDALKAQGISDSDIRTSNYNLNTQTQGKPTTPGSTEPSGAIYYVNNQVQVTIHDVSKLGELLDKLVAAGANNIYGVQFAFSDTSALEDQARAKAVKDASNKAQSLASLEGVTLGNVISVSESSSYPGVVYPSAVGIGGGAATPIQPGQLQVSVTLQVTYAIKFHE